MKKTLICTLLALSSVSSFAGEQTGKQSKALFESCGISLTYVPDYDTVGASCNDDGSTVVSSRAGSFRADYSLNLDPYHTYSVYVDLYDSYDQPLESFIVAEDLYANDFYSVDDSTYFYGYYNNQTYKAAVTVYNEYNHVVCSDATIY